MSERSSRSPAARRRRPACRPYTVPKRRQQREPQSNPHVGFWLIGHPGGQHVELLARRQGVERGCGSLPHPHHRVCAQPHQLVGECGEAEVAYRKGRMHAGIGLPFAQGLSNHLLDGALFCAEEGGSLLGILLVAKECRDTAHGLQSDGGLRVANEAGKGIGLWFLTRVAWARMV